MNKKISAGILLTVLTLLLPLASAASFTVSPSELVFSQSINSTAFTATNNNQSVLLNLTIPTIAIAGESGFSVSFTVPENKNDISTSRAFTLQPTTAIDFSKFKLGKVYSSNLLINNSQNSTDSQSLTVKIAKSFCTSGEAGNNLSTTNVDINNKGEGEDDNWKLLDEVEMKVKVENINPEDNRIDTIVKIALYDSNGREQLDLDTIELGRIKGGDDKTGTVTFKVPADLKEDTYFLYVKAYKDGSEKSVCTSISDDLEDKSFKKITVEREDKDERQVIFDDIKVEPSTALCGEDVTLTAKIINIGIDTQEKVKSKISNKELGVDLFRITEDLDEGDEANLEFTFKIPENAAEKSYNIELRNLYDFNDDFSQEEDAAYDEFSELFLVPLKLEGCIKPSTKNAQISAVLETPEEDIKSGSEIAIKATIKNTGEESATYAISLTGYEDFSSLKSISPAALTLEPGKSQDVLITLQLNDEAEGEEIFSIKALFDSKEVEQQVSLSIAKSGFSITGSAIGASLRENWFIWLIVLINVILIVAIIIVAVKMSRA